MVRIRSRFLPFSHGTPLLGDSDRYLLFRRASLHRRDLSRQVEGNACLHVPAHDHGRDLGLLSLGSLFRGRVITFLLAANVLCRGNPRPYPVCRDAVGSSLPEVADVYR